MRSGVHKLPTGDGHHDAKPPPIVADYAVAARHRYALPVPQGLTTSSLLTILGAVEVNGPGEC